MASRRCSAGASPDCRPLSGRLVGPRSTRCVERIAEFVDEPVYGVLVVEPVA
jgi:hypothetical protein